MIRRTILAVSIAVTLISITYTFISASGASKDQSGSTRLHRPVLIGHSALHATERATGRINFDDQREVPSEYIGASQLTLMLDDNVAEPLALASIDLDEDGVSDLVSGYQSPRGGILTIHRGNENSIHPNSPDAQQRKAAGDFTDMPFLSPAQALPAPVRPDFLVAGDFDADGHADLVVGERGSDALYLMAGDGHGGFTQARRVGLGGRLTALIAGEINRPDGLTDMVAGVAGPDGPEALVFESPEGAMRGEPERIKLPAEAIAIVLGQFEDHDSVDLAVGAGSEVVLVCGRDRKLSVDEAHRVDASQARISTQFFPFAISAMAIVDLPGESHSGLALLSGSGRLSILKVAGADSRSSADSLTWQTVDVLPVAASARSLISTRSSSQQSSDLIVLDSATHQLQLLNIGTEAPVDSLETLASPRPSASTPRHLGVRASFDVGGEPKAILPIRLNQDALNDLVILRSGFVSPSVVQTAAAATITVNDTADTNIRDNVLTLREAVLLANGTLTVNSLTAAEQAQVNGTPAAGQLDAIAFNIPGTNVHTINIASALPTITDAVTIDGTTQPGYAGAPVIELHGGGSGTSDGLTITGGNSTVRGLVINNFTGGIGVNYALVLKTNGNDLIEGNYLGTNAAGDAPTPNGAGVSVTTSNNTIGGTTASARNVISGNTGGGILIQPTTPSTPFDGNKVLGNFIGTNAAGTAALNNGTGQIGVRISSSNNLIGGTVAGARNVVSGYGDDVEILGGGSSVAEMNLVQGNYIGTDAAGSISLGSNTVGVAIIGNAQSNSNTIGGTSPAARNVIAVTTGGTGAEVSVNSSPGNTVQGNYLGTNAAGTSALGNAQVGVQVSNSTNTNVGGTASGAGNLISGRSAVGVTADPNSTGVIQGNAIGTNAAGTAPIPNTQGVSLSGNMSIGGPALSGARNLISGNGQGITISVNSAVVQGNLIGTQADGTSALGNTGSGITIRGSNNIIGGTVTGEGNVIAFNGAVGGGAAGIAVNSGTGNSIRRNQIYANGSPGHENLNRGINFGGNQFLRCNDHCDGDSGINNFQNFPVLTSAVSDGSSINISGALDSTANTSFAIEFFSDTTHTAITACNPAVNFSLSQGQTYLGSTTVTTDASCSAVINITLPTVPSGQFITATATNLVTGDTSEFSASVQASGPTCAISCPANQTASTGAGSTQCGTVVNYPAPVANGMCGTVTCTPPSSSLFAVGTTTVNCAASAGPSCSFTVTVTDNTPPTITCPANMIVGNDAGQCTAVVNFTSTTSDNCSGAVVRCSPPSGSTFAKGTTQVNCNANDAAGNTAACGFTVTVNDTQAPTIACPANITRSTDLGQCSAGVSYSPPIATDNCPGSIVSNCLPASGTVFAKGVTAVNCTASDGSGNVGTCSFSVTVNDTERPAINCPANITRSTDDGRCSAFVNYTLTATDNCPGVTVISSPPTGSSFPKGTTTVRATATDTSGNASTCTFAITVNDNQNPTIICPVNLTRSTDPGQCSATVSFNVAAADNCPGVTVVSNPPSGSTFPKGTTTVSSTAADASGNTASCTFTVTVKESKDTSLSCSDISRNTDPGKCSTKLDYSLPVITGDCSGGKVSCAPPPGFTFPKGITPVKCTAPSAAGKIAICSFAVTITDRENPTISCHSNITAESSSDGCGAVVKYPAPAATDNCPAVTVSCAPASGSFFAVGATPVTCTATDSSSNRASCVFTVTVKDTTRPTIFCPSNIVASAPAGQPSAVVSYPAPNIADNCAGATVACTPPSGSSFPAGSSTVNCAAMDRAGNQAVCSFTVMVNLSEQRSSIAFDSNRDGNREIYIMNADGTNQSRLTFNSLPGLLSDDLEPVISPDGTKIAFTSYRDGNYEIYVMKADGSNPMRLSSNCGFDGNPSWSPDGTRIAFTGERALGLFASDFEIFVMNADGSNRVQLTTSRSGVGSNTNPVWSPDGNQIAFMSTRNSNSAVSPNHEIYVMNAADGSNQRRLTNNPGFDGDPAWSPNGEQIAFTSSRNWSQQNLGDERRGQQPKTAHRSRDIRSRCSPGVVARWRKDRVRQQS